MNQTKQLGEGSVLKLLLKFSIPAIVGMLVNALYNVVDRIFIGNAVGSLGLAGLTVTFPIMLMMMAFGVLVAMGGNALMSIKLGEDKKEDAEQILGNATTLLIGMALVITVVGLIFIDPILQFLGASVDVFPYAKAYITIILYGTVFQAIGFGLNNFIRGEGNPKIAMLTMLIGAITNIILDYIFIIRFGWGVEGAAWATLIAKLVSAIWVLYYFLGGTSVVKIKKKNLKLELNIVKGIFAIGLAPFAMQFAATFLNIILNNSLNYYGGDLAISGMGIIYSIMTLLLMPVIGISQGVQPIIGFNYGAKKFNRVKEALLWAILMATIIVVTGFISIRAFPHQLVSLFNPEDLELIEFASHALKIFLFFLPIIGFQIIGANYFQAVGKPKQAMILSLSRQVLILIPALLILPRFYGLNGVFMAAPLADLVASIITGLWLMKELQGLDAAHFHNPLMES
ncbi:MATE efflux family protein [Alkaliphilus metalliredigens QYMF]|uniref:Multidrug export protein MepA n=1 Tax=Alkaliphilus metalliredigens (strain QYMF) TaxID=293826 RepID=A6TMA4_ALKMQ|nr:MATE family efflux transporter [Alkaliphilus metalliredigens]ABR47322.1 MATE efflux family protein [Alkaliphilus metalliredigens QYMF]